MPTRIPNTEFYADIENATFRRGLTKFCADFVADGGDDYKRRLVRMLDDESLALSQSLPTLCIHHEGEVAMVNIAPAPDIELRCPECGWVPVEVVGFRTGVE